MRATLFDHQDDHINLLPLTYLKSIADLRVGILTIREKWNHYLGEDPGILALPYQQKKYPLPTPSEWYIRSTILPDAALIEQVRHLQPGTKLVAGEQVIAARSDRDQLPENFEFPELAVQPYEGEVRSINRSWEIFQKNADEIKADYEIVTEGRTHQGVNDPHTAVYGTSIFVEEGASIKAAILNAENGPIYIGKNAVVGEGAIIRGPFAMCEKSQVSLGAKIKGNVTLGPYCKLGGEASQSVLQAYSNKSHDGYLGSSVIGEWCNIGADTNNSNLRNDYRNVKMWDYHTSSFIDSGLQFCGLIMGDHSKSAINTMFNTGTTIGISCNVFGAGFPRNIMPSFSWGGHGRTLTYSLDKAFKTMELVLQRRQKSLTEADKEMMTYIFDQTAQTRSGS